MLTIRRGSESVPKSLNDITDAELSVMEVLWDRENGVTVRQIVLAIYGRHEHSLHGGVKSFLDRLMEKGYVTVNKSGFAHRFSALVTRQEFVGGQLKRLAESHFGGSVTPMLMSLVELAKLSRKDRAAIEKIVENIKD
jgi:predicted transcriptional regulator